MRYIMHDYHSERQLLSRNDIMLRILQIAFITFIIVAVMTYAVTGIHVKIW